MSGKLKLTGRVVATRKKQLVELGPGTDVIEIALPDKKYGLTGQDVERIVKAGVGVVISDDAPQSNQEEGKSIAGGEGVTVSTDSDVPDEVEE